MTEESKIASAVDAAPPAVVATPSSAKGGKDATKKEESDFPFAVAVSDVYEGPLDLLLDLIRKQDIDIYDIPIAKITAQYLAYVEKIRELDVNVAAEFIYMAAVLIHIKSKMLLPRDPLATAEEQEDPRSELVNRLLEHEKFKSAAQMLLQKQQIEDAVLTNPSLKEFMDAEGAEPELAADVIDLVKTFQQVLERVRTLLRHNAYSEHDPQAVEALVVAFCSDNAAEFHRADGAGYAFWLEQVARLDRIAFAGEVRGHPAEPGLTPMPSVTDPRAAR